MSKKREIENVTYRLAVEEWKRKRISEDGYLRCEFKDSVKNIPYGNWDGRCRNLADDVHHRKGRGKWLSHTRYFLGLCRFHHDYVETHKRDARKRGYILYK